MLAHLANTWILARLLLGAVALLVASAGLIGAIGVLRDYDLDARPDERTLMLERRAELVATALQSAFALQLLAAVLTVVVSDRLSSSIRGAMCAHGVIHSGVWGPRAIATSVLAALGAAAWIGQRRVDVRLRRGSLVRTLSIGAIAVTALMAADAYATWTYLMNLDVSVVATCCTVFVDAPGVRSGAASDAHARWGELWAALVAMSVALGAFVGLARRASAGRALLASGSGLVACALAVRALVDVVAPFAYESPQHRCAYCLMRGEGGVAGPVVLVAVGVATLLSVAVLAMVPLLRREGARLESLATMERTARVAVGAFAMAIAAGAWPVLAYRVATGTFDLFR